MDDDVEKVRKGGGFGCGTPGVCGDSLSVCFDLVVGEGLQSFEQLVGMNVGKVIVHEKLAQGGVFGRERHGYAVESVTNVDAGEVVSKCSEEAITITVYWNVFEGVFGRRDVFELSAGLDDMQRFPIDRRASLG